MRGTWLRSRDTTTNEEGATAETSRVCFPRTRDPGNLQGSVLEVGLCGETREMPLYRRILQTHGSPSELLKPISMASLCTGRKIQALVSDARVPRDLAPTRPSNLTLHRAFPPFVPAGPTVRRSRHIPPQGLCTCCSARFLHDQLSPLTAPPKHQLSEGPPQSPSLQKGPFPLLSVSRLCSIVLAVMYPYLE